MADFFLLLNDAKGIDYSFLGGAVPGAASFTRASTGSRFNSSGNMESIASNAPRFDNSFMGTGRYITNPAASTTNHWRTALSNVKSGANDAKILCIGDSITGGYGSTGIGNEERTNSYPAQLAGKLNAMGISARGDAFLGNSAGGFTYQRDAVITAYTGGWASDPTTGGFNTLGGWFFYNNGAAGNFTIAPTAAFNTLRIFYATRSSAGVLGVSIDGGAVQNYSLAGSDSYTYVDISAGSLALHTVNLTWISGGALYVAGMEFINSTKKAVRIYNAGWSGAKCSDLVGNTYAFSPLNGISHIGADLIIIEIGVNDKSASVAAATYGANLSTLVTTALGTGASVIILRQNNTGTSGASYFDYMQQVQTVANTNNIPIIDMGAFWGSGASSLAAGLINSDNTHPTLLGYTGYANEIANTITAAYDTPIFNPLGLLYEPSTKNFYRDTGFSGWVDGISLATNMTVSTSGGLTVSPVAHGTECGMNYVDIRFYGTTTGTNMNIFFDTTMAVGEVTQSNNCTFAMFVKQIGGTINNIPQLNFYVREYTSAGTSLGNYTNALPFVDHTIRRQVWANRSMINATVGRLGIGVNFLMTNSAAVDITLRFYLPTVEIGSAASSPLATSGSEATRSADQLSFTVPSGASKLRYTFDDNSTQDITVSPGAYTVPANLNRSWIKRIYSL